MQIPKELLVSLRALKDFDEDAFINAHHANDKITSIRINPAKTSELSIIDNRLPTTDYRLSSVPWSQYGYYLDQRPSFTFDPLFHAGCYYVQEASSMFLEQISS